MAVAVPSADALRALALQLPEAVKNEQQERQETRWVDELAFVDNGLRFISAVNTINNQEQAAMWRHRGGPYNWRKGHQIYYKRYNRERVLAQRRRLRREQRACEQAVTEHIKRTQNGFFPGTSFQLRFRF